MQGAEDREDYNDVMDRIQQVRQASSPTHTHTLLPLIVRDRLTASTGWCGVMG